MTVPSSAAMATGAPLSPSSSGGVKVILSPAQCPFSRVSVNPNSIICHARISSDPSAALMYSLVTSAAEIGRAVQVDAVPTSSLSSDSTSVASSCALTVLSSSEASSASSVASTSSSAAASGAASSELAPVSASFAASGAGTEALGSSAAASSSGADSAVAASSAAAVDVVSLGGGVSSAAIALMGAKSSAKAATAPKARVRTRLLISPPQKK